jgi:hypothetical protein
MQPARAHGLILGGIGLHREEDHLSAGDIGHVIDEVVPDRGIDRRVLDRRKGEDDGIRVVPLGGIERQVGDQIAVTVAVLLIERAARAVLRGNGLARNADGEGQ